MIFFASFLLELILLFFSSKAVINALARIIISVTRSHKVAVYTLSFLFFPGTVIHELAHMFMAMLLQVPVGEVDLFPKINGEEVRLGSVQLARSDPIRRFFIGVAPFIVGLSLIFMLLGTNVVILACPESDPGCALLTRMTIVLETTPIWILFGLVYGLFIVSNTMFSSKKDMEGAWVFILAFTLIVGTLAVVGVRIPQEAIEYGSTLAQTGSYLLAIPLLINAVVYAGAKVMVRH